MKNVFKKILFAVALVGAVVGLLSGCNDKQESAKDADSTHTTSDHHVRTYQELLKEQQELAKDPKKFTY